MMGNFLVESETSEGSRTATANWCCAVVSKRTVGSTGGCASRGERAKEGTTTGSLPGREITMVAPVSLKSVRALTSVPPGTPPSARVIEAGEPAVSYWPSKLTRTVTVDVASVDATAKIASSVIATN